jgi:hypothetical protein
VKHWKKKSVDIETLQNITLHVETLKSVSVKIETLQTISVPIEIFQNISVLDNVKCCNLVIFLQTFTSESPLAKECCVYKQ